MRPETVEWRRIPSAPDYEVSALGEVRRAVPDACRRRLRTLRIQIGAAGRCQVSICVDRKPKTRCVHRLVAEAFIGPCPPGMMALHRDGDHLNNRWQNLYYGTAADNAADARRHGTFVLGERNGMAKLTPDLVRAIRGAAGSHTAAAAAFGISTSTVSRIRQRRAWAHVA